MSCSWDRQETDSVKWTKNHTFREQKWAGTEDLSGGLRGRTVGSPTANDTTEERGFFPKKHVFLLFLVGLDCILLKGLMQLGARRL